MSEEYEVIQYELPEEYDEVFYGYCFPKEGGSWHTPIVTLNNSDEIYRYTQLHKRFFEEIRVTDIMDSIIVHMIKGQYVYPPEWVFFNTDGETIN